MIGRTVHYILKMLPGFLAAAAVYGCAFPRRKRRLAEKGFVSPWYRETVLLLFAMFAGGMAAITLTPRGFDWMALIGGNWTGSFFSLGNVNLVPFATFGDLYILVGNIVMFLPFGFFPALLFRNYNWRKALFAGFCVTAFIEITQLFVGRAFDIDDLMLNTLGAFCGFLLQKALGRGLYCIPAGK
jgi:glycopeptide antibiotics resistance protein